MMTTVNGYYNGTNIVLEENVQLTAGQRVIVTIMRDTQDNAAYDRSKHTITDESRLVSSATVKEPKADVDLSQFVIPYERGENGEHIDAQEYVRRLRDNDRL